MGQKQKKREDRMSNYRTRQNSKRADRKMGSNDSPEIPDREETSKDPASLQAQTDRDGETRTERETHTHIDITHTYMYTHTCTHTYVHTRTSSSVVLCLSRYRQSL